MKTSKIIIALWASLLLLAACENSKGLQKNVYQSPRHYTPDTQTESIVENESKAAPVVKAYRKKKDKIKKAKEPVVPAVKLKKEVELMEDVEVVEEPEVEVAFCQGTPQKQEYNDNTYDAIQDNEFMLAQQDPLSTFSIDVDNASYSVVRQYLVNGQIPPANAVRIEELINYFDYNYAQPTSEHPFSIYTEVASAPWNPQHKMVMMGIKGKDLDYQNLKPGNLVFLIDTSGSMGDENKLPLLIKSFKLLVNHLPKNSKVAIVTYAGSAGLVLPPTKIKYKTKILSALDHLYAGGSTAGGAGIKLAYKIAEDQYLSKGNNRVILATDGDFNVGAHSPAEMVDLIKKEKEKDIYLTILGFGMGNYKDGMMEQISNAGNGNYFYIDAYSEAQKVFQKELVANMFTIAKDVKIQVEFNPTAVKAYRLIGYANRKLANKDFTDDTKDAGELGAGHTVTALYEIIPAGSSENVSGTDPLKYQNVQNTDKNSELLTVKLRYKPIKSNVSKLIAIPVANNNKEWQQAGNDFRFACSVAGFGMLLRDSKFKAQTDIKLVKKLVAGNADYQDIYKNEYITLLDKYEALAAARKIDN